MHYALLTYGSTGDVRPFVALALGLQKKGHRVTLAAPENFKTFVESHGIPYHPLAGDMETIVNSEEVVRIIRSGNNFTFLRKMVRLADQTRSAIAKGMQEASQSADVLVTSTLNIFATDALAEKYQKKWAMLLPSPPMIETKEHPFPDLDGFNFPWYNRLTYRLVNFAYWQAYKSRINDWRQSIGLRPKTSNPLRQYVKDKIPTLYIFSPQLIPRPKDWNDQIRITGFLTLQEPSAANPASTAPAPSPDPLLESWLHAGPPPLYIGFGSIPIPNPERLSKIIQDILDTTTHRIVFSRGWSPLPNLPNHPNLYSIDHVDHGWLLPQCKAAIHHGGAGTVGATLKARIPSIVVSIFGDQAMWGKIVQRQNVGIHLPFKRLTTRKLLAALTKAETPPISHTVISTGEKVNAEDGVTEAVETLSRFFN